LPEEHEETIEQLASVPRADGALVPAESSSQQQQQQQEQQQQEQQQPLVADVPAPVADAGRDNEPSLTALSASSSLPPPPPPTSSSFDATPAPAVAMPLALAPFKKALEEGHVNDEARMVPPAEIEEQDDEEEAPRRASLCSTLTAGALGLAMRLPILGPVVSVCAEIAIVMGELVAESGNTDPDQPPVTSDHVPGEASWTDDQAVDEVLKFQVAEAEAQRAMAIALDSSSPSPASSTPTSSTNTLPPSNASNADVAAGSSNGTVGEAVGQTEAAPSSSPPSPSSSRPSLIALATGMVLFSAKCAVGVAVGGARVVGKTVKKGAWLTKTVVVGGVKMVGRAVMGGFRLIKGLGSLRCLEVVSGDGMGDG